VLPLLRRRDFALLWVGGFVSLAGDWVLHAALPFFVYERTGSTVATAAMIVAELAPGVLVGSLAGVYVDRWNRKWVLVHAGLAQAAAVSFLLLVAGNGAIWLVYAVAAAASCAAAFTEPAEGALLPELVEPDELIAANALAALNNRLARIAGLAAGGVLFGAFGLSVVVMVDVASFLAGALLIALVAAPHRERPAERASAWHEWLDGVRLVRRERRLALLFAVLGLMTFGGTMLDPLAAGWVHDVLHRGPAVFAGLTAVSSASGLVGSVVVGRLGARLAPHALVGWTSVAAGVLLAVRFNVPSAGVAFALAVPNGITSVASAIGVQTLVQQTVRAEQRGRVLGSLGASGALLSLAGAAVGGALGEFLGIVPALDVAASLVALSGVVVLRLWGPAPDSGPHSSLRSTDRRRLARVP
jgi:Na+/melibiose symporter-like transporter